jgi:hypothetical protein
MPDPILTSLRQAVRDEIAHAFAVTGFATPRAIARLVCTAHPEDIRAIGTRLAEDALTEIARREFKQRTGTAAVAQLQLPHLSDDVVAGLPPAISIPVAGGDPDNDDGVIYKPLTQATLADVEAHLGLLGAQILADTRRHRALKELRDLALAAGATAGSLVLALLAAVPEAEVA